MIDAVDEPLRAAHWPQRGLVKFEGVQMRYRPELPAVLRSVDFTLEPGVKGAVVGRSGAGKSSLSVALLRLAPLEGGKITIDGVDIATLGLSLLRTSITLIQQDAVMFSGSLRSNIDPFGEHTDAQLEQALGDVDFARLAGGGGGGGGRGGGGGGAGGGGGGASGGGEGEGGGFGKADLSMEIAEGGGNLSAGTRQLVMLARAMLRSSRILIMDEATASIDYATDAVIQRVVREQVRSDERIPNMPTTTPCFPRIPPSESEPPPANFSLRLTTAPSPHVCSSSTPPSSRSPTDSIRSSTTTWSCSWPTGA